MDNHVFRPVHTALSDGKLGVTRLPNGDTRFLVWAPKLETLELYIHDQLIPMTRDEYGYFASEVTGVTHGDRYAYRVQDALRPDPVSRSQPDGVHTDSEVIFSDFMWTDDAWSAPALRDSVMYELHVGTFTPEGTFDAIIPHLSRLKALGITTLELMPLAQFPGGRNWGYDGVGMFATQNTYGGLEGLKRLVNAAHGEGLAVILDVVYNHIGPEGNYLGQFGHYFTGKYHTPWGDAINFDGPHSDHVKRFFIENALFWLEECHIDGFRLDATQAFIDMTAVPFLTMLTATIHAWGEDNGRLVVVIAENGTNNRALLTPRKMGGAGLDAVWLDDLHHVIKTYILGEKHGYLSDYGAFGQIVKVLDEGFAYTGDYSVFLERRRGTPSRDLPLDHFVANIQNHDHAGNRLHGERLTQLVDFETLKLIEALNMTSPYVPLIFMGAEYAETAPFMFFTSHSDEGLIHAVREGRKREFAAFNWTEEPPDPQALSTFERSKLNHDLRHEGQHAEIYEMMRRILQIRPEHPAMTDPDRNTCRVVADEGAQTIIVYRGNFDQPGVIIAYNLHPSESSNISLPEGRWHVLLDTTDPLRDAIEAREVYFGLLPRSCVILAPVK